MLGDSIALFHSNEFTSRSGLALFVFLVLGVERLIKGPPVSCCVSPGDATMKSLVLMLCYHLAFA